MTTHPLVQSAERIEALARDLADAYRDLTRRLHEMRGDAYYFGGEGATNDFNAVASPTRVNEEIAGALKMAGLDDVLQVGHHAPPVADLATRWRARVESGVLDRKRERGVTSPETLLPGQGTPAEGIGSHALPEPTVRRPS